MQVALTVKRLRELMSYDPSTGVFVWKIRLSNRTKIGAIAGSSDKNGYLNVGIAGKDYKLHRLVFLYMTGEWPKHDVDHINGVPHDNKWSNLRDVSHAMNMQNVRNSYSTNKLGVLGVNRHGKGFRGSLTINGKTKQLPIRATIEEAANDHLEAKRKHYQGCTV